VVASGAVLMTVEVVVVLTEVVVAVAGSARHSIFLDPATAHGHRGSPQ